MKNEDQAFSSVDFVGQCLVDKQRTLALERAINKVVKKNDIVMDLGTGSGIMALLAAGNGAKKVYAVEFDNFVAGIAEKAVKLNKFNSIISILTADARTLNLPQKTKLNVVLSEMLTTGMIDESQVQVINNLHTKKLVDTSTIFIPSRHDTRISLINADFTMFGFKIPMILHLWKWHSWNGLKIKNLTDSPVLNSIYFNKKNNGHFEATIRFKARQAGRVNSLYLTSRTFLTKDIFLDDTEALNAPMIVPIPEKMLKKGQGIKMKISYVFGAGYKNFRAKFI